MYTPGYRPTSTLPLAKPPRGTKRPAAVAAPRTGYYTNEFNRDVVAVDEDGVGSVPPVIPASELAEQLAVERHGNVLLANLTSLSASLSAGAKFLVEQQSGASRAKKSKTEKEGLDDNVEEEDLTPVVFKGLHGSDNGVDVICWDVRTRLPPFTGDWKEFWKRFPRVSHPVRESLDTAFLRMDPVNGLVTMRDHDRGAPRKIKQYLKDNIRVSKTKAWVEGKGMEHHDIGLSRNYVEPTGCYDVLSAVHQYASNVWMIRRDDSSGLLLLRVLHDVKFFAPLILSKIGPKAERDKKQLEVIIYFVDDVLEKNSQRGRLRRPPLEYDEVRRAATTAANKIYSGSGVGLGWEMDMGACSFDPYTTAVEGYWQGGRGGGGGGGGGYGGGAGRAGFTGGRKLKNRGRGGYQNVVSLLGGQTGGGQGGQVGGGQGGQPGVGVTPGQGGQRGGRGASRGGGSAGIRWLELAVFGILWVLGTVWLML